MAVINGCEIAKSFGVACNNAYGHSGTGDVSILAGFFALCRPLKF